MSKNARKKYKADNTRLKHKRRNVFRSSHGKWTYELLMEHQNKTKQSKNQQNTKDNKRAKKG